MWQKYDKNQIWVMESQCIDKQTSYPNKELRNPKHFCDTIKVIYSLYTEHVPYKMYM